MKKWIRTVVLLLVTAMLFAGNTKEAAAEETAATCTHSWTSTVTSKATCDREGTVTYCCSKCGETKTGVIPKRATHDYSGTYTYEDGKLVLKCASCGKVLDEGSDVVNCEHVYQKTTTYNPTGSHTIIYTYTCEICGESYTEEADCKHLYYKVEIVDGVSCKVCTTCGKNLGEYDSSLSETCTHSGYGRTPILTKEATSTEYGEVTYYCNNCGEATSTKVSIHPYQAYTVDIGNGQTDVVYGYYDDNGYADDIIELTNEYREENGLNALTYNKDLQEPAEIRARESSHTWSHTRPNGTSWYTINSSRMNGENLASGYTTPSACMTGWKNSEGHNANLLRSSFKSIAVSVFHRYTFSDSTPIPTERVLWSQEFSTKTN